MLIYIYITRRVLYGSGPLGFACLICHSFSLGSSRVCKQCAGKQIQSLHACPLCTLSIFCGSRLVSFCKTKLLLAMVRDNATLQAQVFTPSRPAHYVCSVHSFCQQHASYSVVLLCTNSIQRSKRQILTFLSFQLVVALPILLSDGP